MRRFPFSGGVISTIVGNGAPGFAGDGGPGTDGRLNSPRGLNIADNGSLLIADSGSGRALSLTRIQEPLPE